MPDLLRLLAFITINEPDGCWLWNGKIDDSGYGRVWFRGKATQSAHRSLYTLVVETLPPEIDLHHTCRVRNCVNPNHLVPVPREGHRHAHLVAACPQGHVYTEANTLMVSQGKGHKNRKRRCRACAREYMAAYHLRRKTRH